MASIYMANEDIRSFIDYAGNQNEDEFKVKMARDRQMEVPFY